MEGENKLITKRAKTVHCSSSQIWNNLKGQKSSSLIYRRILQKFNFPNQGYYPLEIDSKTVKCQNLPAVQIVPYSNIQVSQTTIPEKICIFLLLSRMHSLSFLISANILLLAALLNFSQVSQAEIYPFSSTVMFQKSFLIQQLNQPFCFKAEVPIPVRNMQIPADPICTALQTQVKNNEHLLKSSQ